jgi:hypothetical protein
MRRLWKEELLGKILVGMRPPAKTPPPEDVRQAPAANDHIRVFLQPDAMRQLLRSNNSVQKQTIARILELHY